MQIPGILRSRILSRRLACSQAVSTRSTCRSRTVREVGAQHTGPPLPALLSLLAELGLPPAPLQWSQRQAPGLRCWDRRTGQPMDPPVLSRRQDWAMRVAVDTPGPTSPGWQGCQEDPFSCFLPCPRTSVTHVLKDQNEGDAVSQGACGSGRAQFKF